MDILRELYLDKLWSSPYYVGFIAVGILFILFHVAVYARLAFINNKLNNKSEVLPLRDKVRQKYKERRKSDAVSADTFIQEYFSSFKIFRFFTAINVIKIIQMTVSVFILVGVLGTFVGLSDSLSKLEVNPSEEVGIDPNLAKSDTAQEDSTLMDNISEVLSGIYIAFYSSIIGMSLSLIMTIFLKLLNTEQLFTKIMLKFENDLEEGNEETLGKLISVMENVNQSILTMNKKDGQASEKVLKVLTKIEGSTNQTMNHLGNLGEFSEGFNKAAENLEGFNKGLQENVSMFTELFGSMKQVTDSFGNSVHKLNDNFDQLFFYFEDSEERQRAFMETFDTASNKFQSSLDDQKSFHDHFASEMEEYVRSMGEIKDQTRSYLGNSNELLKSINEQNGQQISNSIRYQTVLKGEFEQLSNQNSELTDKLDVNISQLKDIFDSGFSDHLSELRHTIDEKIGSLADQFVQLSFELSTYNKSSTVVIETMDKMVEEQKNNREAFNDRERSFVDITEKFTDVKQQFLDLTDQFKVIYENIDESVDKQSESLKVYINHQQQVAATYEDIETGNQRLLTGINEAINNINKNITNRENEIEETLKYLVNSLDENLNQKFSRLVNSMGEYVNFSNSIIEKQLEKIGLLNHTYEEGSKNHMLTTMLALQNEFGKLNQNINEMTASTKGINNQNESEGKNNND